MQLPPWGHDRYFAGGSEYTPGLVRRARSWHDGGGYDEEGETMATVQQKQGVRLRRFTKREYYRMGELGFFRGQRVELIEGRIMVMSPQGPVHSGVVDKVAEILRGVFAQGYWVRSQLPVDLGQPTEPEPDVSVVVGSRADYTQAHPTSAVLIVEVSDSTLSYDRNRKGSLYARAGVQDYWIVNIVQHQLEVYRAPIPDPRRRYGHRYSSRTDLLPGASVTPLALPGASVLVADLFG
jgi:Uma2 family endonuclease